MSEKTISIDLDAYERLKGVQRKNESMSDTIRRVAWDPEQFWAAIKQVGNNPLSHESIAAIEEANAARVGVQPRRSTRK